MKYIVIFVAILSQSFSALAACGEAVTGVMQGEKTVAIQMSSGKSKRYIIDDDGYLVISLAVAHCRGKHPQVVTPKLNADQFKCVTERSKVAVADPKSEKLNFLSYDPSEQKKVTDINAYKEKCGVNYHYVWEQALDERKNQKLTCGADIRDIVRKAVSQNEAYTADKTSEDAADSLKVDADKKIGYLGELTYDRNYVQRLEKIINNPNATVGEFDAWVAEFENPVKRHGYYSTTSDELKKNAENYSDLVSILREVNADFSFSRPVASADGSTKKCYTPFNPNLISRLKEVNWGNDRAAARAAAVPEVTVPATRAGK
ncbi:MAG: hypothetical protein B7Y39_08930 [Bdellovibrio sp. 28-41-41]|nr:MAG: hypothetical protein B7Y39_08930 [Bdellovibrio sp. 28-41-41]